MGAVMERRVYCGEIRPFFSSKQPGPKTAALTWAVCQLWPSILKGKAKNQLWISTVSYGSVPYLKINTGFWLLLLKTEIKSLVFNSSGSGFFDPGSLIWIFHSGSRVWIFSSRIRNTEPTKHLTFFTQKIFLSSGKYDLSCLSGIRIFFNPGSRIRIPAPGVKKPWTGTGSTAVLGVFRIRKS
jgi:hypothetical protein